MLYVQLAPSILRFILTDASNPRAPPFSSKWVTEPQKLGQYKFSLYETPSDLEKNRSSVS